MARHVQGVETTKAAMRKIAGLVAPAANEAGKRSLEPQLAVTKENAPSRSGRLKKDLILRRLRGTPKTRPVYAVGIRPGSTAIRYAHVLEWGRAANASGAGGMVGTRYFTRAFDATKENAIRIWGKTFGPALEKSAARIAARNAKGRP
jgi:hypothetical protein